MAPRKNAAPAAPAVSDTAPLAAPAVEDVPPVDVPPVPDATPPPVDQPPAVDTPPAGNPPADETAPAAPAVETDLDLGQPYATVHGNNGTNAKYFQNDKFYDAEGLEVPAP